MSKRVIFISSVQKELQPERRALADFIQGDPLLRRYFTAFLFEDLPATDRQANDVYLDQVDRCAVYLGIFGNDYGPEDAQGLSATEHEFQRATKRRKPRLIFVKGSDDPARQPKMMKLIRNASGQLVRRRFSGVPDLLAQFYASMVQHLEEQGLLRTVPFDAAVCAGATLQDLSAKKLRWFLARARQERRYALAENTPMKKALEHLNLLAGAQPSHAAILLFGENPQRFLPTAEVKCLHFHGTEIRKPIPSYQVYKGTVFEMVDAAVDFVMSKLDRWVGTREHGPAVPVKFGLPKQAVAEAIVNAVAHRDYDSKASVQVMLFNDRLEVWNPGELPPSLTFDQLRLPHPSIPHNPLICDPLFLAHYNERAGTGTLDMIALCREADLPEPEFRQDAGQFVMTLWRDWLTESLMREFALSDRQMKAVRFVKTNARINNAEFQDILGVAKRTAHRDLTELVRKGILARVGTTGKGTYYVLAKRAIKGPKGPAGSLVAKGAKKGPNGPQ
jgi:predicted HTH transcriptional regulator